MSIYEKLAGLLSGRREGTWKVGFAELEGLIGRKLPASAWKYPAWWSNDPSNNSMTKVWLRAGWRTEQVDVPGRTVVFRRIGVERTGEAADGGGYGDRPRAFEYASARAPETKMATKDMAMLAAVKEKDASGGDGKTPFERLYGCMKGTIKIMPGVDVTKPVYTDEEWAGIEAESDRKWDELVKSVPDQKGGA